MLKRILLTIFIVLIVAGLYCAWMVFGATVHKGNDKYFYIPTGTDYRQVKNELIRQGYISSDFWFDKVASYADYNQQVKAGRYEIKEGMSIVNLVKMLKAGRQAPVNLVITKLRTIEDLAKKISNNLEPDSATVYNFLTNNDSLSKFGVDTNTLMTLVIPNTYRYFWNTPVQKG
ncbi:hypothetical protein BH20BAC1_BH20BAC1_07880 [soil metagenome]